LYPAARGAVDSFAPDFARRTRPILYNNLLTEPLRQPLGHHARENVSRACWRIADDDAHRPRRIDLSPGDPRNGGQHSGARGEMQKLPSGKCEVRHMRAPWFSDTPCWTVSERLVYVLDSGP